MKREGKGLLLQEKIWERIATLGEERRKDCYSRNKEGKGSLLLRKEGKGSPLKEEKRVED